MKLVLIWIAVMFGMSLLLGIIPITAQNNTVIALQSDETTIETGQYYLLTVYLQDVSEVWQINAEIGYDPTLVYVVGTVSGSPMTAGDFFTGEPAITIRNSIEAGHVTFTHSLVSPAIPKSGSGVVATFQIYPLSAGTTQIRFTAADLTKVNFTQRTDGNRDVEGTEELPVIPAFVELTITGETVKPPDESTPTPEPTATTDVVGRGENATAEPTLVNVTLAPNPSDTPEALPTLIPDIDAGDNGGTIPILPIALGLLLIGIIGGVSLLIVSRR
jgi:hypothetical protein